MKILFLTDNFPPEYNAPATRTYEHCKRWVELGAEVTVITCFPNFPQGKVFKGYKNTFKKKEELDGIKVIRVWSFISSNKGFFKRTLDFVSFALTSFVAGLFIKTDVIVATSPQFFTAISGCSLALFKRKKWVMEVRDLWPESIIAVGAVKSKRIIRWLERLELFLYRTAGAIVVVTDAFKKNLVKRGIESGKIAVIKNGANLHLFRSNGVDMAKLKDLNLEGYFVIGYIGTHGLAHNLSFIVKSIERIQDDEIRFLFIGDGAEKENIVELAKELNLKNIYFHEPIEKREVPIYLSIIDAALVPLKDSDTFKSVIPSKIFESAAMRKPILLGVRGESKEMIEAYNAGLCFEPEDKQDFLSKVQRLKTGAVRGDFVNGCQELANDFDRAKLAKEMLYVIQSLVEEY